MIFGSLGLELKVLQVRVGRFLIGDRSILKNPAYFTGSKSEECTSTVIQMSTLRFYTLPVITSKYLLPSSSSHKNDSSFLDFTFSVIFCYLGRRSICTSRHIGTPTFSFHNFEFHFLLLSFFQPF